MKIPKVAEQFGNLVANADYSAAHALLTNEAQKSHSPDDLRLEFEEMTAYAHGPIREVSLMEEFVMDDWPGREIGDIASVYVGLIGDEYVEAVVVIVTEERGDIRIRHIEWGRP